MTVPSPRVARRGPMKRFSHSTLATTALKSGELQSRPKDWAIIMKSVQYIIMTLASL
jgi:hypothetical protein